jgi:hypothetical protein
MFPNPNDHDEGRNYDDLPDFPQEGGKDDGRFAGRTYLYIRTHPADTGAEPLAAGLQFWISPDIRIRKPDNSIGTEAVAGQLNHIEVTVTNAGGIPAIDAYVDVFLNPPAAAMTPATAILLGGQYINVAPYSTTMVSFPWTPPTGQPTHRCLIARVSLIAPPDTYSNPAVFEVVADRHVAQRNISVITLPAGDSEMRFDFQFANSRAANTRFRLRLEAPTPQVQNIILREAFGERAEGITVRALRTPRLLLDRPLMPQAASPMATPKVEPEGCLALIMRLLGLGGGQEPPKPDDTPVVELPAGGVGSGKIALARDPDAQPGDAHVVNVVQIDEQTGQPVGGLTLIVRYE